jgi:hypothetical protein
MLERTRPHSSTQKRVRRRSHFDSPLFDSKIQQNIVVPNVPDEESIMPDWKIDKVRNAGIVITLSG